MFCDQCGKQMPDDSTFCPNCGAKNLGIVSVQPAGPFQEEVVISPVEVAEVVTPVTPVAQPVYQQPVYQQPVQPAYQPGAPTVDLTKPVSVLGFMGMLILLSLPIVNLVMLFIWAFSSHSNKNKKNLSIAILIFTVIGIILGIVFGATVFVMVSDIISNMSY